MEGVPAGARKAADPATIGAQLPEKASLPRAAISNALDRLARQGLVVKSRAAMKHGANYQVLFCCR